MVIPKHVKCNRIQPHSLGGPDAVPPVFPGNALGMHLRTADLEGFPVQHELLVPFSAEPEHNGGSSGKSGFLYILDSLRASPCQCSHSDGHQCGRPTETILLHHVEQLIHLKTVANNNFFSLLRICGIPFPSARNLTGPDGTETFRSVECDHVIYLHPFVRKPEDACLNLSI